MIFIDYDKEDCFDYHVLDVVLPDSDFVYDFEGLGLDPCFDY
jgi:hypothetical protein